MAGHSLLLERNHISYAQQTTKRDNLAQIDAERSTSVKRYNSTTLAVA